MTDAEQREAARQFVQKWQGKGNEDEDGRSYWIDLLHNVLDMDHVTDRVDFEKKVYVDGNKKRIDAYIPETRVLIEQKSLGKGLDQKIHNSGDIDLTPYEQAKRYNDNLSYSEKARWIVTSNFSDIWIYDMDEANTKELEPVKLHLSDIQTKYSVLDFLIKDDVQKVSREMGISLKAGELVGQLYDALLAQYKDPESEETLKSLNKLCVRIVFCLYAEDAGVFGSRNMFHDYMKQFDCKHARNGIARLFKVLDQKPDDRDPYLADDDPLLASFPYVNGGLFSDENIEIPPFTDDIMMLLLQDASEDFNWSEISPTIFGAVFESTLNPETRRSGGMHYTSIENIHKVIDPLFLDDLKSELNDIRKEEVWKTKEKKLKEFQKKLASLRWLDPACGSGNFLTETYLCVRRLENAVISELHRDQITFAVEGMHNPIQVDITQFYGIEINDFAVTVAKTALWIAESQMIKETEDIIKTDIEFLPLTTNANIVEGNALRMNWNDVVPASELDYIMGNPPFVGAMWSKGPQRDDIHTVFPECRKPGQVDYVVGWYVKASKYMKETEIRCAFVSTNSICQGQQVALLWKPITELFDMKIDFAYRTFIWDSEANIKAHVHCVIVGFSHNSVATDKYIYDNNKKSHARHINAYLIDAPDFYIERRENQISGMPSMHMGIMARDGGNLIMDQEEYENYSQKEPQGLQFVHRYMMGREFLHNTPRYCFWLVGAIPNQIKNCPILLQRISKVRESRLQSSAAETRKLAETPSLFAQLAQPTSDFIAVPKVSSQRRRYIPIGFLEKSIIVGDKLYVIENVGLYHFGVMCSNIHNAWMRFVAGRLKSDYSYSNTIVYNNFPWPSPTDEQKSRIEQTAQGILDARALYPDSSLADLYDPLTMPPELQKAHRANDRAVMHAYGFDVKTTSESDCVARLMEMYQELTEGENK